MEPLKKQVLENLGLARNEVAVYLALMRLGSASAGEITKESGLHRRNVYDSLEKLIQRGLVGYVKKGKTRHFEATSPRRILDILREKRKKLLVSEKNLESAMPELLTARQMKHNQEVSIFMGMEGRKLLFEDILSNAKENWVLGGYPPSEKSVIYMTRYNRRRAKAGILNRMIYNKRHKYIDFLKSLDHTEVRIMPRELDSTVSFNIYNDKVGILFCMNNRQVTILIENDKVANDFREYFSFIWDISRKA